MPSIVSQKLTINDIRIGEYYIAALDDVGKNCPVGKNGTMLGAAGKPQKCVDTRISFTGIGCAILQQPDDNPSVWTYYYRPEWLTPVMTTKLPQIANICKCGQLSFLKGERCTCGAAAAERRMRAKAEQERQMIREHYH